MKNKSALLLTLSLFCLNTLSAQQDSVAIEQLDSLHNEKPEEKRNKKELVEYRRSSIYSVLIKQPTLKFGSAIDSVFMSIPIPDKFNNHDLSIKSFESTATKARRRGAKKEKANQKDITNFIIQHDVPKQMVAKWFNRNEETGAFDMHLINERGYYDATQDQISQAENTIYGKSILADAGTELIEKTFLLINDITFVDHGDRTEKAAGWLSLVGEVATAVTGEQAYSDLATTTAVVVNEFDGFAVNITSHLYCLHWSDNILMEFYEDMWHDETCVDLKKKEIFNQTKIFNLKYIGKTSTTARNLSIKSFATTSNEQQLIKVCTRAVDKSIVELQREYDEFKVNIPIRRVNEDGTVEVAIGLKEGVNSKSEYEVLMPITGENNKVIYDKVGRISPIEGEIWDNRFGALEDMQAMIEDEEKIEDEEAEGADPTLGFTKFEINSGANKIMEGCLVREITIKRVK